MVLWISETFHLINLKYNICMSMISLMKDYGVSIELVVKQISNPHVVNISNLNLKDMMKIL